MKEGSTPNLKQKKKFHNRNAEATVCHTSLDFFKAQIPHPNTQNGYAAATRSTFLVQDSRHRNQFSKGK
jgi:hypothetical protein